MQMYLYPTLHTNFQICLHTYISTYAYAYMRVYSMYIYSYILTHYTYIHNMCLQVNICIYVLMCMCVCIACTTCNVCNAWNVCLSVGPSICMFLCRHGFQQALHTVSNRRPTFRLGAMHQEFIMKFWCRECAVQGGVHLFIASGAWA